jgi:hypothetical protein
MFNLFKKRPKFGDVYAVQIGDYAGQMFILISQNEQDYDFLSSPLMENQKVPLDKFDFALKEGIIEYVERLPKFVRNIARAQHKENQKD